MGEQWEKQRDHGPGPKYGGVSSTMGGDSAKPPCSILRSEGESIASTESLLLAPAGYDLLQVMIPCRS